MLEISINKKLKDTLPPLAIGWVSAGVRAAKQSHELWQEINSHLAHLTSTMTVEAIAAVPEIAAIRVAYKALGKDPSHYRGWAEALLRRVLSWLLRALERDEFFLKAKRLFAEWPK